MTGREKESGMREGGETRAVGRRARALRPGARAAWRGRAPSGLDGRIRRAVGRVARGLAALAALALIALGPARPVEAQEAETRERIERLERRVEELERRLERAERADTTDVAELRRRMRLVLRELETIRLGAEAPVLADSSAFGLAPAASKVYRVRRGVSIGGYGEVLYQNFADGRQDGTDSGATDQVDALRAILYVGYRFSDRILFNSELELEHGSTGQAGSASVEFAYLDYLLGDRAGLRGGLLLAPMGFLNEIHEPTTFLGAERPLVEQRIIPSTWRENGVGAFGEVGDFSIRAYVMNGLDAVGGGSSDAGGFSAAGLRGGRQKGSKAVAEDFALVARADWTGHPGLLVGTSAYVGGSGQNAASPDADGETVEARTWIWEGHAQYRARGLDVRGLFALATVDDVARLNALRGLEGAASIGERLLGGYVQLGYDLLSGTATKHELLPYARFERLNTQDEVPEGFSADPANDVTVWSFGAAWRPIPGMILKADYQIHRNEARTGVNRLAVALGYSF